MYAVSDRYAQAVRASSQQQVMCGAWLGGSPVAGATGLPVLSGSVTDDSAPGIRRTATVELAPLPGLFDLLAPVGVQLRPVSVLRFPDGTTESVPLGLLDIVSIERGYATGSIRVQAQDKWGRIQRARFLSPAASTPGLLVVDQIANLIRGALGAGEAVSVAATSTATVGSLVWDQDRDQAIMDLAESIGAWVFFDRNGTATIADLPGAGPGRAVWTADSSARGVLLSADRGRDRSKTANIVVVNPEKADGAPLFATQYVWDANPASPTFAGSGSGAGPNPPDPSTAGPFNQVPYFYTSPLIENAGQAVLAGGTILARVSGLAAQMSLTQVRNHALDALDAIDVLLPQERYDIPRAVERHLIDRIVHPFDPDAAQSINTRATGSTG